VTTLPSNLALVGEDLARATLKDARRSAKRRRLVAYAIAFAVLALTASAAIATGWLSEKTPATSVIASPPGGTGEDSARMLLSNLGPELRVLRGYTTAAGAVCLTLTGFEVQCVPAFLVKQQVSWYARLLDDGTIVMFGLVRDDVGAVDAVSRDGRISPARLANGAFYVELSDGLPKSLLLHLKDGSEASKAISPCPPTAPDCVR
jgi:hypothetical protein